MSAVTIDVNVFFKSSSRTKMDELIEMPFVRLSYSPNEPFIRCGYILVPPGKYD